MTMEEFTLSLKQPTPAAELKPVLLGLWHDAKGNWTQAHAIAQGQEGTRAYDRLHAYLHRKEGDEFNAKYWYRRAGAAVFHGTLDEEWNQLVVAYLED